VLDISTKTSRIVCNTHTVQQPVRNGIEVLYAVVACPTTVRARRYAKARQLAARRRRMERQATAQGVTISNLCACGCGLVIKPSIKRPFHRGHKQRQGVLRVVGVCHG
jgi:hypothetical protein